MAENRSGNSGEFRFVFIWRVCGHSRWVLVPCRTGFQARSAANIDQRLALSKPGCVLTKLLQINQAKVVYQQCRYGTHHGLLKNIRPE
jgi:hypothetical protein